MSLQHIHPFFQRKGKASGEYIPFYLPKKGYAIRKRKKNERSKRAADHQHDKDQRGGTFICPFLFGCA
jgi:hypothetical protein